MDKVPSHLYHYTNIDSLAMILKNQNIRFNTLCNMDDLQEQYSMDQQNFGKFMFASSWTEESDEYIPMWKMYTRNGEGIRIKLKTNPFKKYSPSGDEINLAFENDESLKAKYPLRFIVPMSEMMNDKYFVYGIDNDFLCKVEYTNDNSVLKPTILSKENGQFIAEVNKLGRHKNIFWEFQKEWRYILGIIPLSCTGMLFDFNKEMGTFQNDITQGKSVLGFDNYHLNMTQEAFKKWK